MGTTFQIVISAKDRASGVVNGVNSALSRVPSSLSRISSAMDRMSDTSALDRLQQGAVGLARPAMEAARGLGVLNNSLGLMLGAGSVAGAAALVARWGAVGVTADNASQSIGVTAGRLRTLQNAAGLAGLSADAMTGSMGALATTLQDASFGRNNEAAAMLNILGITAKRTAGGAWDLERALGDIAESISKQTNPQTQAKIAQMFGVEALLPMLRKGRAGWNAYIKDIERLASVSEETQKRSEDLGISLNKLEAAATGVGTTLEARLSHRFGGVVDGMTAWISKNRETAATLTEIGSVLAAVGLASRAHPLLGLMTAVAGASALAYEHIDDIRRTLDSIEQKWNSIKIRPLTEEEKEADRKKDEGKPWWQQLLPKFEFKDFSWEGFFGSAQAAPTHAPAQSGTAIPSAVPPASSGAIPSAVPQASGGAVSSVGISEGVRRWDPQVNALSAKYGIDADFVRRIMQQESGGRQFGKDGQPLTSSAGAIGPMQVMPGTFAEMARRYGIKGGITDPDANIEAGVAYLSEQMKRFGDEATAAAAYNAGPERVKQNINDGKPLPSETKNYVASIAAMQRQQPQAAAGGGEQKVNVTVTLGGNVPEGTSATAQTGAGTSVPTRIEYAMQSFARP